MKTFVTIFPNTENVHLIKDVGQIPYYMYKYYGFDSSIVTYKNSEDYPYLKNEVKGLKLKFIKNRGKTFFLENAVLLYIYQYSKNIDVLNLYHLTQESIYYGILYKIMNPKGILYLKLDMDNNYYKKGIMFSENRIKNDIHLLFYFLFKKIVDLISSETNEGFDLFKNLAPDIKNKIYLIPNGAQSKKNSYDILKLYNEKKNIILTVGRIGVEQKNHELLLEAISNIKINNWIVYVIGPIERKFRYKIKEFYDKYPEKRKVIRFLGPIYDRDVLLKYYKESKVFILTSKWEGFPIVLLEAIVNGNYIIGTDSIPSN